jgi:acyl-[acyl-carrier-protein]-phospholipid O-acyltransferase/long-chain-fatty-acid--[acyl-carrier-protein] ligase
MPQTQQRLMMRRRIVVPLAATVFQTNLADNAFRLMVWIYLGAYAARVGQSPDLYRTLIGLFYTLPWVFLSLFAGEIADRYAKRGVIRTTKMAEVFILVIGAMVMAWWPSDVAALAVLTALATRNALFGPATYGLIPEIVAKQRLSFANGLVDGMTFLGAILGTSLGGLVIDLSGGDIAMPMAMLAVFAVMGVVVTYLIVPAPPASPFHRIHPVPLRRTLAHIRAMRATPGMAWAIRGIVMWWAMAALTLQTSMKLAEDTLLLTGFGTSRFFIYVGVGVALGSLSAGWISGRKIEMGLVPLGGIGMSLAALLVFWLPRTEPGMAIPISMVGFFSGWFVIPLKTFVQNAAPRDTRGGMLGTINLLQYLAICLSAGGVYYVLTEAFRLDAPHMFLFIGICSCFITLGALLVVGVDMAGFLRRHRLRWQRRLRKMMA